MFCAVSGLTAIILQPLTSAYCASAGVGGALSNQQTIVRLLV
jgi:hypothetical protein